MQQASSRKSLFFSMTLFLHFTLGLTVAAVGLKDGSRPATVNDVDAFARGALAASSLFKQEAANQLTAKEAIREAMVARIREQSDFAAELSEELASKRASTN